MRPKAKSPTGVIGLGFFVGVPLGEQTADG